MTLLFSESADIIIEQVDVSNEITLTLRSTSPTAACLWCGIQAHHIQSRYTRRLTDLPLDGRCVHLRVQVRRFFCKKSTCARKIFAEQFPTLALPHAQRTIRLQAALRSIGLLDGGQARITTRRSAGLFWECGYHPPTRPTGSCDDCCFLTSNYRFG
jgi:transposase